MLNGELAQGFAHVFGSFYRPGYLRRKQYTDNGKGGLTETTCELACKVQVDRAGQRAQAQGYVEGDATILVLAHGLDRVLDDDELHVDGDTWQLIGPELDPLKSHWRCRGRRRAESMP